MAYIPLEFRHRNVFIDIIIILFFVFVAIFIVYSIVKKDFGDSFCRNQIPNIEKTKEQSQSMDYLYFYYLPYLPLLSF